MITKLISVAYPAQVCPLCNSAVKEVKIKTAKTLGIHEQAISVYRCVDCSWVYSPSIRLCGWSSPKARHLDALAFRLAGCTYRWIGKRHGVSKGRASELVQSGILHAAGILSGGTLATCPVEWLRYRIALEEKARPKADIDWLRDRLHAAVELSESSDELEKSLEM